MEACMAKKSLNSKQWNLEICLAIQESGRLMKIETSFCLLSKYSIILIAMKPIVIGHQISWKHKNKALNGFTSKQRDGEKILLTRLDTELWIKLSPLRGRLPTYTEAPSPAGASEKQLHSKTRFEKLLKLSAYLLQCILSLNCIYDSFLTCFLNLPSNNEFIKYVISLRWRERQTIK